MILAHYTIRSKQSYIFQTNRMLEITGGSAIIADAFDCLIQEAKKSGLQVSSLRDNDTEEFHLEKVKEAFQKKMLHMAELFIGGGNDTVLYADEESFQKANRAFTYALLTRYPGLIPLCVGIEIEGKQDAYREDYAKLMQAANIEKSKMLPGSIMPAATFSEMDRNTQQPIAYKDRKKEISRSLQAQTKHTAGKRKRNELKEKKLTVEYLDEMVTKKGKESLLAIVHADGNNMGVKIQNLLGGHEDYDFCVTAMRRFTKDIQMAFIDAGIVGIKNALEDLKEKDHEKNYNRYQYRLLIADGDDFTFVCNARYALTLTKAYLNAVYDYHSENSLPGAYSSCAGICIFHSHYPFARAYELAELACDSAKEPVHQTLEQKDREGRPAPDEECWIDFHFLHSGTGGDLEELRKRQGTKKCMARPWRVAGKGDNSGGEIYDLKKLEDTVKEWKEKGCGRSNLKTVSAALEQDASDGEFELFRINYKNRSEKEDKKQDIKKALQNIFNEDKKRMYGALYDAGEMYDIWFGGKEIN